MRVTLILISSINYAHSATMDTKRDKTHPITLKNNPAHSRFESLFTNQVCCQKRHTKRYSPKKEILPSWTTHISSYFHLLSSNLSWCFKTMSRPSLKTTLTESLGTSQIISGGKGRPEKKGQWNSRRYVISLKSSIGVFPDAEKKSRLPFN